MPLPFAPKPDESKVYQSLKAELLTELTPDQFDSLRESVFAQGTDGAEDEYRRLLLLSLAANQASLSGPMPGTQQVLEFTESTGSGSPIQDLFTPAVGEVYQLIAADLKTKNCNEAQLFLSNGSEVAMIDDLSSTTSYVMNEPIYIGYPCHLEVKYVTSSGNNTTRISVIRVR